LSTKLTGHKCLDCNVLNVLRTKRMKFTYCDPFIGGRMWGGEVPIKGVQYRRFVRFVLLVLKRDFVHQIISTF